jgi:hypothetical protein
MKDAEDTLEGEEGEEGEEGKKDLHFVIGDATKAEALRTGPALVLHVLDNCGEFAFVMYLYYLTLLLLLLFLLYLSYYYYNYCETSYFALITIHIYSRFRHVGPRWPVRCACKTRPRYPRVVPEGWRDGRPASRRRAHSRDSLEAVRFCRQLIQ